MKQVSANYKNQIKEMGREIDSIISYYNHYQVITENNKFILTEDGEKILTEQIKESSHTDITAEDIYSSKVITHGTLLKTMMKEFDFEVKQDIKIGSIVSYKFGLKVNDSYEYVDYGNFIVNQKEFNEDTKTYSYVAYDKLLFTMIPYVAEDISERQSAYTLYDLVNYCCEFCDLQLGVESFPNGEREITNDTLKLLESSNFTFRDVLDYATEVTGCSSYLIDDSFVIMPPQETNLILYADSFKDTNVIFNKVFGPINSILFSRSEDTDVIETKDDESIEANGVTQIKIKDNPFLEGNDRADYFEEMFDVLDGLTYSLNDVSSTGITYLEFNDKYKISIDGNEYDCLLLNDEIIVEQGLEENIFTEEPQEKQQEYVTSRLDDRGQKWANIQVKKDVGEIILEVGRVNDDIDQINTDLDGKVGNNEIITRINLSPEQASIQSNKISLQGKTINLTSDTINIASNNFSVDTNGDMTCNNATMTNAHIVNGSIDITQESGSTALPIYLTQVSNGITYNSRYGSGGIRFIRNGVDMAGLFGNPGSSTNTGGVLSLKNLSGTTTIYARGDENNSGGYFSIANSSGTQRIYAHGDSGWITCVGLTQTSLEKEKKNFERLENALEIVKDVDIYKYNMKDENNTDKKHIGFVIGDKYNYREEITSLNNDGVDTYSMISVLWQAVKEQQKEIEELKERIGK